MQDFQLDTGRISPVPPSRSKQPISGDLRSCIECVTKCADPTCTTPPQHREQISFDGRLDPCVDDCDEPCTQDCVVVPCEEPCAGDVCLDAICENSPRSDHQWRDWPCYDESCNQLSEMVHLNFTYPLRMLRNLTIIMYPSAR